MDKPVISRDAQLLGNMLIEWFKQREVNPYEALDAFEYVEFYLDGAMKRLSIEEKAQLQFDYEIKKSLAKGWR